MTYDRSSELFNDGWREPGDDCERLSYYITFAVSGLLGLATVGWGGWKLFTGTHENVRIVGLLSIVVGGAMAAYVAVFFARERRHWDLRHLTADRVVAGGILFGIALALLGLQGNGRGGNSAAATAALIALGGIVATFFLVVGLIVAYAPALSVRHRLAGTRIERRYAIDEKLNEIDEHPCPRADGMTPVVTLRLRDGRTRTMVCAESAYEAVRLGASGTAVLRGKRLERFHPN